MLGHSSPAQNSTAMRPAMQSLAASPGSSMTSDIAIHESDAGQLAEVRRQVEPNARPSRVRPPRRGAKEDTAGAAASPAVDPLSDPTGCRRHGVLSRRGALRLDGRCLRPRGEGIGQRPGCRPGGRNCRQGQSARPAGPAPVPDRSGAVPDCRRSGRGAARHRASPDQRAQGHLSPATGRAPIGERYRGLRRA